MKKLFSILVLASCSAPTVVVDTSSPTVTLQGPTELRTAESNRFTLSATAPLERQISSLHLEVSRSGSSQRFSASITGTSEGIVCVRLDPSVDCGDATTVLELPAEFGRDGSNLQFEAQAQDDGPARRFARSPVHQATVADTSAPEVQLLQPERLIPDRAIALRVRVYDRHSGAAALNYRLRILSNGCITKTISGSLTGFVPQADDEIAIIAVPVPVGLRSGTLAIDLLEVADRAATANKTAIEARQLCIGTCADTTAPEVTITRVRWLIDGQTARALTPGDGVHPGAQLEVTVQGVDEHSNMRQLWTQVDGSPPAPPPDEDACPDLSSSLEQNFQIQAPDGPDGQGFNLIAGGFDDVGTGADHNAGLAEPFNLEINDDVAPSITNIVLLDESGSPAQPEVGGRLRVSVSATDTFGAISRLQLRVENSQGDPAVESEVESIDPAQNQLDAYASPMILQLPTPNDLRAITDWTARVTVWDNATPPNPSSSTLSFLPQDNQPPRLSQVSGGGSLNLSNGRQASVQISGSDAARYIASVSLVDLLVGQTEVGAQSMTRVLDDDTSQEANAVGVSIPIPITAKEGTISAVPRITDDSGNSSDGQRVQFNLVDNVQPSVSAMFNPNILVPGGPVRLEVNATDINSTGIARIQVSNVQHITWNNQSVVNQGTVVFTGTVAENPGSIGTGLPVEVSVTATDQAAASNQRTITASGTIRDEAGPIITVTEVTEGTVGGSANLRIRARDLNGVVAQTSYVTTINQFNSNNQIERTQTVNYTPNDRVASQNQDFTVAIPSDAEEGQYSILFTATDGEGNQTQLTATGNLRLSVVDRTAPIQVSINSLPDQLNTGASSAIRVTARDRSSGIARIELSAAELNQTLTHNCNNTEVCTHTFALPVASDATHQLSVNLQASAIDGSAQSNTTTPAATVRLVDDVEPPTQVAITNPLPVQINTGDSIQLQIRGQDVSSGLASAEFTLPCGSAGPYSFNNQPKNLVSVSQSWTVPSDCDSVGIQDVQVRMVDAAGNTSNPATLSLNLVDATDPVVSFRSPPTTVNSSASANILVRATDAGAGVARITLNSSCGTVSNGGILAVSNGPALSDQTFTLSGLQGCPPGVITLTLGGQDGAGNAATSVQHQLTLRDDEAPSTALILSGTTVDVSTSVTMTATVTDASSGLAGLSFTVPCGTISAPHPVTLGGETTEQSVQRTWTIPADCRTLGSQNVSVIATDQSTFSTDGTATVTITIRDVTNPTVSWVIPPTQVSLTNGVTMTATANDASSGVASLSFSLDVPAQGSFSPISRTILGAPTTTTTNSELTVASTLTHGTQVTVHVQSTDVATNDSAVASTLLSVLDDVAPISIVGIPQLGANRQLGGARFAVVAGETIAVNLSATDPNSGIETVDLSVLAGGNTTLVGETAGNSGVNFSTTVNYQVPGSASHGDEFVLTPRADDVSAATGFTSGSPFTLVVDSTAPDTAPSLSTPAVAATFGVARNFRCLNAGTTALAGLRGTADTVGINVQISPLPAGFPADGSNVAVNEVNGAWSFVPQGFNWVNHTEYSVTLRARDAVGNQQITGTSFTLRGDTVDGTWTATPTFSTSVNNRSSGLADYQPIMTGTRSNTNGGSMVVVGQFTCGTETNQADSTANNGSFTVTEPTTLSLGSNNSLNCTWRLSESFCDRIRTSSGNTIFNKANTAPETPTNPRVDNDSNDPAVSLELWPEFTATSNDPFDVTTNQISQSRTAEVQVYSNNTNTVIWSSGNLSADLASGVDFTARFPRWRPPNIAIAAAGDAVRRNDDIYWFSHGNSQLVHILNLDHNVWTSSLAQMAGLAAPVAWSSNDGITALSNGTWLRVTQSGQHLLGTDAGGTITWDDRNLIAGFPSCSSVRLSTLGEDGSRALLWCRSHVLASFAQLLTYVLDEPLVPGDPWTITSIPAGAPVTVATDFQTTRLGASDDYRVVPGTGNPVQVLGGRLNPGVVMPSWTITPSGTGDSLELTEGCSIVAQSDTTYIVLSGGNEAWLGTAEANPSDDTLSSANLPGGLTVNGIGNHLAGGDTNHDVVALVWHAVHGLRPIVWVPVDTAYAAPPDPLSGEAALVHNSDYTWTIRLTDQGGLTGSFPANANDRHGFSVSIP